MDAIPRIRTALAVAAAVIITASTANHQQPTPDTQPAAQVEFSGYDFATAAAQATQDLQTFIRSNTTTTTTTVPAPAPKPVVQPANQNVWDELAQCESNQRWDHQPVSGGFSGGIMFHIVTWRAMGGTQYAPDAYLATREQQIDIATKLLTVQGWGAWPGCTRKLGIR